MSLLIQILLRMVFGLATGMAITSPRQVTSGYYRNHLYVTLGLSTLAALLAYANAPSVFWIVVLAAIASYCGSVCWLYEAKRLGQVALFLVAVTALVAAWSQWLDLYGPDTESALLQRYSDYKQGAYIGGTGEFVLNLASVPASGLLLGFALASMLLGHWYLNSPGMELEPLRRLILALGAAVVFQAIVAGVGLGYEMHYATGHDSQWLWFLLLRWSFGLVGVLILAGMAWQILKIPNTQSATGILYVAVIGTFVGETTALLLSAESLFPL